MQSINNNSTDTNFKLLPTDCLGEIFSYINAKNYPTMWQLKSTVNHTNLFSNFVFKKVGPTLRRTTNFISFVSKLLFDNKMNISIWLNNEEIKEILLLDRPVQYDFIKNKIVNIWTDLDGFKNATQLVGKWKNGKVSIKISSSTQDIETLTANLNDLHEYEPSMKIRVFLTINNTFILNLNVLEGFAYCKEKV